MALVFAVMHLYQSLKKKNASVHSFFNTFKNCVYKSTELSTIPACPSLMCFLTGQYEMDQFFETFVFDVCGCFV